MEKYDAEIWEGMGSMRSISRARELLQRSQDYIRLTVILGRRNSCYEVSCINKRKLRCEDKGRSESERFLVKGGSKSFDSFSYAKPFALSSKRTLVVDKS